VVPVLNQFVFLLVSKRFRELALLTVNITNNSLIMDLEKHKVNRALIRNFAGIYGRPFS
jgi:hypothetical protein